MATSLGGIDALVFTAGVGEHSPTVRAGAATGLGLLGVGIDADINREAVPDCDVTAAGSTVGVLVIEAREDVEIARGVRSVIAEDRQRR
jgi:acetate kinase